MQEFGKEVCNSRFALMQGNILLKNWIVLCKRVKPSFTHQPRHAKASILIIHFYTIMSCSLSSNHTVNDTLPYS